MNIKNYPKIGDKLFLLHKEVVVVGVWTLFGFVTVRYLDEMKEFCVDVCALSQEPDLTNSISLKNIGGGRLKRTNFEIMMSMSAEELADYICSSLDCLNCPFCDNEECHQSWRQWLKSGVKQN